MPDLGDPDTTGWCDRGNHVACHGELRASTGYHWFCACECHPEPVVPAKHAEALNVWRAARERRAKAPDATEMTPERGPSDGTPDLMGGVW